MHGPKTKVEYHASLYKGQKGDVVDQRGPAASVGKRAAIVPSELREERNEANADCDEDELVSGFRSSQPLK